MTIDVVVTTRNAVSADDISKGKLSTTENSHVAEKGSQRNESLTKP